MTSCKTDDAGGSAESGSNKPELTATIVEISEPKELSHTDEASGEKNESQLSPELEQRVAERISLVLAKQVALCRPNSSSKQT